MIKRTCVLLVAFAVHGVVNAQPVSMQQALQRAQRFMPEKTFSVHDRRKVLGTADSIAPFPYYIFNAQNNGDFVIVSGDDRTEEILGYSDVGCLDWENMPSNVDFWLNYYTKAIEHVRHQGVP